MGLENINKMRESKGLSLDELSELSGVPKGTLSKITAGITKNPSIETIRAIVYAMGYSLDDLDTFPNIKGFPAEIIAYIDKYKMLDKYGKNIVKTIIDMEYQRCYEQLFKRDK